MKLLFKNAGAILYISYYADSCLPVDFRVDIAQHAP